MICRMRDCGHRWLYLAAAAGFLLVMHLTRKQRPLREYTSHQQLSQSQHVTVNSSNQAMTFRSQGQGHRYEEWLNERRRRLANSTGIKKVILFTYMRGGSTFLGSLFEEHSEAIYWYEGLGPFYRQYLATRMFVYNPVWFENDYSLRKLKGEEKSAIADYLASLLSCDFDAMYPTGTSHQFIGNNPTTRKLLKCMDKSSSKCKVSPRSCKPRSLDQRITNGCPGDLESMRQCWVKGQGHCAGLPVSEFTKCHGEYNQKPRLKCVHDFEEYCQSFRIRATKVHRLSMQAVEEVIWKIPDIYIIFYIRDPRGIYSSRKREYATPPFQSLCEQMQSDNDLYESLHERFPGVFLKVRYEDLSDNSQSTIQDIYSHIGETIPSSVLSYVSSITHSDYRVKEKRHGVHRQNSSQTAWAWQTQMSLKLLHEASKACGPLLRSLNYPVTIT